MTAIAPILGAINGRTGREYDAARLLAARPLRVLPAPRVVPQRCARSRVELMAAGVAGGVTALLLAAILERVHRV